MVRPRVRSAVWTKIELCQWQPHGGQDASHETQIKVDYNTAFLLNCALVPIDWLQMGVTMTMCLPQSAVQGGKQRVLNAI